MHGPLKAFLALRPRHASPSHRARHGTNSPASRLVHRRSLRLEWLEDRSLLSVAPTGVDLLPGSDSGILDNDDLTNLDNSAVEKTLQFEVAGTVAGATVTLYADGTVIGTTTAAGTTTTVTTDGTCDLVDGPHSITARQTEPSQAESDDSPALGITVDTLAPFQADQGAELLAGDGAAGDYLGHSVSIDGNMAIVGARGDDDNGSNSGSAYIYKNTGSGWVQIAKLTAADGAENDYFGSSVSISSSVAIVGAYGDDDLGSYSGSAYVFADTGSGWTQIAKLTADDGYANDYFGYSVAISSTRAVVGAYIASMPGDPACGVAYVFEDTGSGWVQVAKLMASDRDGYRQFGYDVSISGTMAIVGDDRDPVNGNNTGSAYIFEDTGTGWTQVAKLTAADGEEQDRFGYSVSISGTAAIVGAYKDDDCGSASGSAYVFEDNGSSWTQVAKLTAGDGAESDNFGKSVSISDTAAIVGAPGDDDHGSSSGSAYVFKDNGFVWTQVAKLTPSDGAESDRFGADVSISGSVAIVGAYGDDDNDTQAGAAYIYDPAIPPGLETGSDTGVDTTDNITADNTPTLSFVAGPYFRIYRDGLQISDDFESGTSFTLPVQADGTYEYTVASVDAAGNELLLSTGLTVTIDTEGPATPTVAPDLLSISDSGINQADNLTNDNAPMFSAMGAPYYRVYCEGALVSAYCVGNSDPTAAQADGTYGYTVTAIDAAGNESAPGPAVSVTIDTEAPAEALVPDLQDPSDTGISDSDDITSDKTPTLDLSVAPYFRLYRNGSQISGDYDAGASYTDAAQPDGVYDYTLTAVDAAGNESAKSPALGVTIDTVAPQQCQQIAKLLAGDGTSGDYFGWSVAIDGSMAIVAAYGNDDIGRAYVFQDAGSGWVQIAKLTADDGEAGDYFGCSVSISGSVAIVGAEYDNDKGGSSGSAYIFEDTGSGWGQVAKLTADDGTAGDWFGCSVSISGNTAIVGAYKADEDSAYVFEDTGSGWVQVAKLTANGGSFGRSVSIDGTTVIIGAPTESTDVYSAGAAYVFEYVGSAWVQVARLTADDGAYDDQFGGSVSISGNAVIIGVWRDDDNGTDAGSAYVFEKAGSQWSQVAKLTADDGSSGDHFGLRVSISDHRAIVGAYQDDPHGTSSGSAYIFEDSVFGWTQLAKLTASDAAYQDEFGWSVAISGTMVIVGADEDDDLGSNSGSAYVFDVRSLVADDTGMNTHDAVTSDTTPELTFIFNEPVYGQPSDLTVLDPNDDPVTPDSITGLGTNTLVITFSAPLTVDGEYTVAFSGASTITDAAGNAINIGADEVVVFTIDTTPPAVPAAPDLTASSDTGVDDTDDLTNDTTPTFEAAGAPYFRLYRNGIQISGDYETGSYTDAALSDDTYEYTVIAVDAAGNVSTPGAILSVTIDTQAPAQPTTAPDLQTESDTGVSDSDNITSDTTPTFDLSATPYFRLYRNGSQISGDFENGATYTTSVQPYGTYDYTVRALDVAGNESPPSEPLTVTIDRQGPTVQHVLLKGTAWDEAFLDYLDAEGLGHPTVARLGYRVPSGTAQLDTLSWGNLDTITIAFSEDAVVAQNDLALYGVNVPDYDIADFSYNSDNFTATWTLAEPIDTDSLWISVADTVQDPAGNALDGEWQNAHSAFPSGDGTPGGHFSFAINVLPGDADGDGIVGPADASTMAANWGDTGASCAPGDFTGDGAVNADDTVVLASHWGVQLPSWLPGDADYSGTVDRADAAILASHWGQSGMTWDDGDFDGDGIVGPADAAILAANFGATILPPMEEASSEAPVPSPEARPPLIGPAEAYPTGTSRRLIEPVARKNALLDKPAVAPDEYSVGQAVPDSRRERVDSTVDSEGDSPIFAVQKSGQSPAAHDVALAEEYGPRLEQASLQRERLAWSHAMARQQQARQQDDAADEAAALAVDLLLLDRG